MAVLAGDRAQASKDSTLDPTAKLRSSSSSKGTFSGMTNLQNAQMATEAAEVETRLRQHLLELVEPTLQRQRQMDVRLKELRTQVDAHQMEIAALRRASEGQEGLRGMVDGFRVELAAWDRQRLEHQQQIGDRVSLQEIEINELHKDIEKKTADIASTNRVLKSLGENMAETRQEVSGIRDMSMNGLELGRDKLMKLRDEIETRQMAVEMEQHRLRDGQTGFETRIGAIQTELVLVRQDLTESQITILDLEKGKVSVGCLEVQQQEFSEFARRIDAHVAGLGHQFGNLVNDVKAHFKTAADVVGASTAHQMEQMRAKYEAELSKVNVMMEELAVFLKKQEALDAYVKTTIAEVSGKSSQDMEVLRGEVKQQLKKREIEAAEMGIDIKQLRRTLKELQGGSRSQQGHGGGGGGGLGAMADVGKDVIGMLVESSLIGAALEMQDDSDRKSIALFGMKDGSGGGGGGRLVLPELDGGKLTARFGHKFQAPSRGGNTMSTTGSFSARGTEQQAAPVVSLDKRCLACSGSQATVLAGFKLACLQYSPGPVEYQKVTYSRSELIRLRIDLLNQVKDQLRSIE